MAVSPHYMQWYDLMNSNVRISSTAVLRANIHFLLINVHSSAFVFLKGIAESYLGIFKTCRDTEYAEGRRGTVTVASCLGRACASKHYIGVNASYSWHATVYNIYGRCGSTSYNLKLKSPGAKYM